MRKNDCGGTLRSILLVACIAGCIGVSAWQLADGIGTLHEMRRRFSAAAAPEASPTAAVQTSAPVSPAPTECVHAYGDWITLVAPTATSNGLDERICMHCGAIEERVTNPSPTIDTSPGNASIDEMFRLINEAREDAGLNAVYYCYDIQPAADLRASELNEYYDMQHNRPDGREAVTVFADLGIAFTMLGENYTLGPPDAELAMQEFMNSPSHRELVLSPSAVGVAVSVAPNDEFGLSWVQIFIS